MSKKIAIIGAYNVPNFGDQLLLKVFIDKLSTIDPSLRFIVPFCGDSIEQLENVDYGGGYVALEKADMAIFGGGGFFGETPKYKGEVKQFGNILDKNADFWFFKAVGLSRFLGNGRPLRVSTLSFFNYFKISNFCKKKNIDSFILGTGFGPVTTSIGNYLLKRIVNNAKLVFLRDQESVDFATECCGGNDINLTSDIVLSLINENIVKPKKKTLDRIGLHLGQLTSEKEIDVVRTLCTYLSEQNYSVTMVMDNFDETELLISKKIADQYSFKLKEYNNSISDFIESYVDLDIVITTKLHAGILGYTAGVVPISLPAHPKSKRFYDQIGMSDHCLELSKIGVINCIELLKSFNNDKVFELMNAERKSVYDLQQKMYTAIVDYF
ncbi:polysaccharide pyruvyl transferase family protein [Shewanella oncorhynchi]|uniref:polysaccharide pyruvyl transferase family protein n=1 Tax=Shewanella oncorhynchi TaxID=2726434 RepID=UPI003D7C096A